MDRTKRKLTQAEESLVAELYAEKAAGGYTHAYVTTTQTLEMSKWNGNHPVEENTTKKTIPSGSILKIVMVSRYGDCGLTDDLAADYGYGLRLDLDDAAMSDIRKTA